MRILVVVPKYEHTDDFVWSYDFPLGLGYIAAVIKKAGYQVDCLNLNHTRGPIETVVTKALDEVKYDCLCIGAIGTFYRVTETVLEAAKRHRSRPKTILGGPIVTSEPEIVFKALGPDYAVIGEGEETIVELLQSIEGGRKEYGGIKGIAYWGAKDQAHFTPEREPVANLHTLPNPDYDGLGYAELVKHMHPNEFLGRSAFDEPRVYTILGSRGCPFHCTFCYHYISYRQRSIENILEEIRSVVHKYKINNFAVYDDLFAVKKERLYAFADGMKELQKEVPWEMRWSCQLTVVPVNRDLLTRLKESGCSLISYGFETFSPIVLHSMQKPVSSPRQIDFAFRETLRAKIGVQANFIFGDVAETPETAQVTLDWWKQNARGQVNLGFVQPYPGSIMYDRCIRKGIIKDRLHFLRDLMHLDNFYNMTDAMSDAQFNRLRLDVADALRKHIVLVVPNSIRKTAEAIYTVVLKCPHCATVQTVKNCKITRRFRYNFWFFCRDCYQRFMVVSPLLWIAYRAAPYQIMRDFIKTRIKKFREAPRRFMLGVGGFQTQ